MATPKPGNRILVHVNGKPLRDHMKKYRQLKTRQGTRELSDCPNAKARPLMPWRLQQKKIYDTCHTRASLKRTTSVILWPPKAGCVLKGLIAIPWDGRENDSMKCYRSSRAITLDYSYIFQTVLRGIRQFFLETRLHFASLQPASPSLLLCLQKHNTASPLEPLQGRIITPHPKICMRSVNARRQSSVRFIPWEQGMDCWLGP